MAFQIIRNDITKVKADAIVNMANPKPVIGRGTDSAVYKAAGEKLLLAQRKKIGDIAPGQSVRTDAFRLQARYIIHTVGPIWIDGNHGEREIIHGCYANSLTLAAELCCESIAFPLIATGVYGFPKDEALQIALAEINRFLLTHDMKVILVVFDKKAFELSGKLVGDIEEYIDEHSARAIREEEYGGDYDFERRMRSARYLESTLLLPGNAEFDEGAFKEQDRTDFDEILKADVSIAAPSSAPVFPDVSGKSLDEVLGSAGDTFQ